MSVQNLFNQKMDILRITRTSDGLGGETEVNSVLHNNEPCRINWMKGQEKVQFAKDTYYRDAKVYCRVLSVTVKDLLLHKGTTYEIVNVVNVDEADEYMIIEIKIR